MHCHGWGLQGKAGGGSCDGATAGTRRLPEDGRVAAAQHDHRVPLSHRTRIQQAYLSLPGRPAEVAETLLIPIIKAAENWGGFRTPHRSAAVLPTMLETAAQSTANRSVTSKLY